MSYEYESNSPTCTCDTPTGSESKKCSYCRDIRSYKFDTPKYIKISTKKRKKKK